MLRALIAICATTFATLAWGQGDASFREAMALMRAGEWRDALRTAEAVDPVARDIVEWHRLRAGEGDFDSLLSFLDRNPDWPGLPYLRRRSEEVVPFGSRPEDVVAFFEEMPPQTGGGSLALTEAYHVLGREADAQAQAVLAWISQPMSEVDEQAFLRRYADTLRGHHEERLDMLLWRGDVGGAERLYPLVSEDWRALARARIGLRGAVPGVDKLIEAVPARLADHPGLAFERMQWRARKGRNADAIEAFVERDGTETALGEPDRWAGWRRSLARVEMRAGRTDRAYLLASQHGLTEGSAFADLEWLSGYLALTYRNDPEAALRHFRRFRSAVFTPISLGRAGYWEGRAHEALGDEENARLAYTFGAEYQTSFYGLLAAEKVGAAMQMTMTGREVFPLWSSRAYARSSVFEAGLLFLEAGELNLAERFLTHLAESLSREDIGSLGDFVIARGEPHIATMIGKRAAESGIVIEKIYYPVVDLGASAPGVPPELALAIARRESEFDPKVVSGVGARGLMQLMPGTARDMAREVGISYDRGRLLSDPQYNARLGTAYLSGLMDDFDGNVVLVAGGYNAGPGRSYQWIDRLGDPRSPRVDIVDWIEHVPFDETRNYIMRVSESLPVYRARISGLTHPIGFTAELKGRLDPGAPTPPRPRARPATPVTD